MVYTFIRFSDLNDFRLFKSIGSCITTYAGIKLWGPLYSSISGKIYNYRGTIEANR